MRQGHDALSPMSCSRRRSCSPQIIFADAGTGSMQLIAMFGFVEGQLLEELLTHPALTLRVFCAGAPGERQSVDYTLKWAAR